MFQPNKLSNKMDVSNFDPDFLTMAVENTPVDQADIDDIDQGVFKNFSFDEKAPKTEAAPVGFKGRGSRESLPLICFVPPTPLPPLPLDRTAAAGLSVVSAGVQPAGGGGGALGQEHGPLCGARERQPARLLCHLRSHG